MKYLITGASGFLGQYIIRRILKDDGVKIFAVDQMDLQINDERVEFFKGNINEDLPQVEADVLIHLVGSVGVWFAEKNPDLDRKINTDSVRAAFRMLKPGCLKKVVLASSCQVYGDVQMKEDLSPKPCTVYGRNKLAAEDQVKELSGEFNLAYTILRMSWIYGDGMKKNPIYDILHGEIYLDLDSRLDFVHVSDVAEAFYQAATSNKWDNKTVNVSSGQATSLRDVEEVFRNMGLCCSLKANASDKKEVVMFNELAKTLGWSPKKEFKEGLKEIYESFSR